MKEKNLKYETTEERENSQSFENMNDTSQSETVTEDKAVSENETESEVDAEIEEEIRMDEQRIRRELARLELEKKQMAAQNQLFNQKLEILKEAYAQLSRDQQKLEWEAQKLKTEREQMENSRTSRQKASSYDYDYEYDTSGLMFFQGVTNRLALKKRYRDLIKIFHPDNLAGDKETLQRINHEYEQLLSRYEEPFYRTKGS